MVLFENGADVIDQRPIAANTAQLIRPTFRQTLLKEKKKNKIILLPRSVEKK